MSKLLFLAILVLTSPSLASKRTSIDYRRSVLITPSKTGAARPLIVLLHGCKMGPDDVLAISEFEKHVDTRKFSVLAPAQSLWQNMDKCWNFFDPRNQTPINSNTGTDLNYISELVQQAIDDSEGAIDPNQIYLAGISSGAAMALNVLLCDKIDYRGIAIHSGLAFRAATNIPQAHDVIVSGSGLSANELQRRRKACPKKLKKLRLIAFHGDADTRVVPENMKDIQKQFKDCESLLSRNYKYKLIQGLGHKWSGSEANHDYADPNGPSFTTALLNHFGIR